MTRAEYRPVGEYKHLGTTDIRYLPPYFKLFLQEAHKIPAENIKENLEKFPPIVLAAGGGHSYCCSPSRPNPLHLCCRKKRPNLQGKAQPQLCLEPSPLIPQSNVFHLQKNGHQNGNGKTAITINIFISK